MKNIKISLSMIAAATVLGTAMVTSVPVVLVIGGGGVLPIIIPSAMAAPSDQGCSKSDFFNKDFHGPHSGFNRKCFLSNFGGVDLFPSLHGKSIPDCKTLTANPNSDPGNFKCKHFGPGSASDSASITCKEGTHIDFSARPLRCVPD